MRPSPYRQPTPQGLASSPPFFLAARRREATPGGIPHISMGTPSGTPISSPLLPHGPPPPRSSSTLLNRTPSVLSNPQQHSIRSPGSETGPSFPPPRPSCLDASSCKGFKSSAPPLGPFAAAPLKQSSLAAQQHRHTPSSRGAHQPAADWGMPLAAAWCSSYSAPEHSHSACMSGAAADAGSSFSGANSCGPAGIDFPDPCAISRRAPADGGRSESPLLPHIPNPQPMPPAAHFMLLREAVSIGGAAPPLQRADVVPTQGRGVDTSIVEGSGGGSAFDAIMCAGCNSDSQLNHLVSLPPLSAGPILYSAIATPCTLAPIATRQTSESFLHLDSSGQVTPCRGMRPRAPPLAAGMAHRQQSTCSAGGVPAIPQYNRLRSGSTASVNTVNNSHAVPPSSIGARRGSGAMARGAGQAMDSPMLTGICGGGAGGSMTYSDSNMMQLNTLARRTVGPMTLVPILSLPSADTETENLMRLPGRAWGRRGRLGHAAEDDLAVSSASDDDAGGAFGRRLGHGVMVWQPCDASSLCSDDEHMPVAPAAVGRGFGFAEEPSRSDLLSVDEGGDEDGERVGAPSPLPFNVQGRVGGGSAAWLASPQEWGGDGRAAAAAASCCMGVGATQRNRDCCAMGMEMEGGASRLGGAAHHSLVPMPSMTSASPPPPLGHWEGQTAPTEFLAHSPLPAGGTSCVAGFGFAEQPEAFGGFLGPTSSSHWPGAFPSVPLSGERHTDPLAAPPTTAGTDEFMWMGIHNKRDALTAVGLPTLQEAAGGAYMDMLEEGSGSSDLGLADMGHFMAAHGASCE